MVNMLKVVIAITVLLTIISIAMIGKKTKKILKFTTTKPLHAESYWIMVTILTITLIATIADYINNRPESWTMIIGLILYFTGSIIHIRNIKKTGGQSMGDFLTTNFETSTKTFSKIRHPGEGALLMIMYGLAISLGSAWGVLMITLLLVPSMAYNTSQEDRTLQDKLGEKYIEYKTKTKRIIPGII